MSTTWINRGHMYAPHVTPVIADCSFTVTATNGLGITNLKGQAAQNVFMHTSTTPARGNNNVLNPNPEAGVILVQLSDNYTRLYDVGATITSPNSGTPIAILASGANLTLNRLYVITVLGTSTAADWLALGVPPGITAAVGVHFIAKATGAGVGSGSVQVPATAGSAIDHVELVGLQSNMLGPVPVGGSPNVGGWVMLRTMGKLLTMASYTPAGTNDSGTPPLFTGTPAVLTGTATNTQVAPAAGTIIRLSMYLNQSSVVVAGE